MRALRLLEWNSDPVLTEVDDPKAGPGQVVVRVGGAGACHSDLHLMHQAPSDRLAWGPPFTLGHENAGWVHELGEGVTGLELGQPVAVYGPWGCGTCPRCQAGIETLCENLAAAPVPGGGGGLGLDGGMAEYMLIPSARQLVPLPQGLSPELAAPLSDAGLTPYHAVRRSLPKLLPGSTAVVIGVGGLGHLGVQILKATSAARIIAVDTRPQALALASDAGADSTLLANDDTVAAIRDQTHGLGADVVLDFVGSSPTLEQAAALVRTFGDLTIVGIAGGTLPLTWVSPAHEVSVQSTYWGSRPELVEVLDLAARGLIRPQVTTFPLAQALDAYRQLEDGAITGRAVIVP